jgi:DNA-directed RNA polymerase subunit beta
MAKHNTFRKRFDFSKIPATIQIPNLIEVQKRSYDRFLQMDKLPSEREDGARPCFSRSFRLPIPQRLQLEFVDYAIGNRSAWPPEGVAPLAYHL